LEYLAVDVIVNSRAGLSPGSTFQRKENVSASKFTNSVMNQGAHMTCECTSVETHSATDDMPVTHAAVRHLTCRIEGLGHKIYVDNFFSSPRFLITWTDVK